MFSSSLRSTLVALVACAAFVSATPGLSVRVDGPEAVKGVDNFKVKTTMTNTGDEILKLLNDPNSLLSNLAADAFKITDGQGVTPAFIGIKAKYVPATAIANGQDAFTILAPGQSVEIDHNLFEAYDFSKLGEGTYSVEANDLFYTVNSKNEAIPLRAEVEALKTNLTGKLAVARRTMKKRATFNGCSASQQSQINSAVLEAERYAAAANAYMRTATGNAPRYQTWFGANNDGRRQLVQRHFSLIDGNNFASFAYDCTCTDSNTYAYVYPNQYGRVYFCGAFWRAPNTGTDSKAGTIVHEASHFTQNGGTQDHAYGQQSCRNLAASQPDRAVMNADSHEYFTENNPPQN